MADQRPRPAEEQTTGVHYDTAWSRRYAARLARALIVDDVLRLAVHVLGAPDPRPRSHQHLDRPAIFAANWHLSASPPLCLPPLVTSTPG